MIDESIQTNLLLIDIRNILIDGFNEIIKLLKEKK